MIAPFTPDLNVFRLRDHPDNGSVCANQVHVGDGVYKCQENEQGSNQPTLTLREDGYAREQAQFQLKAPLCPANYHVMGHVGTLVGRDVPDNYKCIHKQLLRSSE